MRYLRINGVPAQYDSTNGWRTGDAMTENYLRATCTPASGDEGEAVAKALAEYPGRADEYDPMREEEERAKAEAERIQPGLKAQRGELPGAAPRRGRGDSPMNT
ncbi:MAG TPA: hypothetical protein VEA99_09880 [Gemmatimonadaceae bacterium]|nr:hypothetical protein [Gemmatimonadaceae bacterium]